MIQTFNFDNMIVRVHRPDLTEEERTHRMKSIKSASERLLTEGRRKGKEDEEEN